MTEINHENILIQVRDALNRQGIKLWVEPYCLDGESIESELIVSFRNNFALEFSSF